MTPGFETFEKLTHQIERLEVERGRLLADMHSAWGVIANVSGGDWTQQSTEWQEAAARWRDLCFHAHALDKPLDAPAETFEEWRATYMKKTDGFRVSDDELLRACWDAARAAP